MNRSHRAPARRGARPRQLQGAALPAHQVSWRRNAGWMSAVTVVISAGNYAYSLAVVRLLKPAQFSDFAVGQSTLLVLANGSMAAIPWAVARYIAVEDRVHARSEALRFGLFASALQAVVMAGVAELVLAGISGESVAAMAALGAVFASLIAAPVGYLQGTDRVATLARFRLVEAVVRIGSGLAAVLLISRAGWLALVGFPAGGAIMLVLGLVASREARPLRRADRDASRRLIRQSLLLGTVQLLLCVLGALDTVEAQASGFSSDVAGSYQAAALLGRLPLFISTAVAIAVYTELTRAPDDVAVGRHVRQMLRFFSVLAIPALIACWTVPHSLLSLVIPDAYSSAATLLRYTSLSGVAIGLINCLTTAHQARGRFRTSIVILTIAAVLQPILLIGLGANLGVIAFGRGLVALSFVTLAAIVWDARGWLRGPRAGLSKWHVAVLGLVAAAFAIDEPAVWLVVMAALTASLALLARRGQAVEAAATELAHGLVAEHAIDGDGEHPLIEGDRRDGPRQLVE